MINGNDRFLCHLFPPVVLNAKDVAYKRNDGRSHNNADNARHDRRGCRIPQCRMPPFTLHPPETPRKGHQDPKKTAL